VAVGLFDLSHELNSKISRPRGVTYPAIQASPGCTRGLIQWISSKESRASATWFVCREISLYFFLSLSAPVTCCDYHFCFSAKARPAIETRFQLANLLLHAQRKNDTIGLQTTDAAEGGNFPLNLSAAKASRADSDQMPRRKTRPNSRRRRLQARSQSPDRAKIDPPVMTHESRKW